MFYFSFGKILSKIPTGPHAFCAAWLRVRTGYEARYPSITATRKKTRFL